MGTAGREHDDGKPRMIKGPVLVGPGALPEPSTGQCWAMVLTGPSCGLHSWLEREQEAVGQGPGLWHISRGQG